MGEAIAGGEKASGDVTTAYINSETNKEIASKQSETSKSVANIQAKTAADQLAYTKQVYGEQSSAYKRAYEQAQNAAQQAGTDLNSLYANTQSDISGQYSNLGQNLNSGYSNALEQAGKTPDEILQLKKDIETGNAKTLSQGRNELAASLATQGVRGGQAATQMRRGIGEQTEAATENVNQLMGSTANQSKAYQQALLNQQLQSQQQLGTQGINAQQQLAQQQLSGKEAYNQALQAFLNSPESAKYNPSGYYNPGSVLR